MPQMTNPHDGLVSFQEAFAAGLIRPIGCLHHKDLSVLFDYADGTPRMTYAFIDSSGTVKALAMFVPVEPVGKVPCVAIGYAVAEQFRGQGLSYEIVEKSIDEFKQSYKQRQRQFYLEAVIGIENVASQKVSNRFISNFPDDITDEVSGAPALHYICLVNC